MFQIIFNELSAAEMSALPKKMQLNLLEQFEILPEDLDRLDAKHFGVIEREGKKLYRYRAKDYRIYFAQTPEGITIHRVLNKNTFRDFLFLLERRSFCHFCADKLRVCERPEITRRHCSGVCIKRRTKIDRRLAQAPLQL